MAVTPATLLTSNQHLLFSGLDQLRIKPPMPVPNREEVPECEDCSLTLLNSWSIPNAENYPQYLTTHTAVIGACIPAISFNRKPYTHWWYSQVLCSQAAVDIPGLLSPQRQPPSNANARMYPWWHTPNVQYPTRLKNISSSTAMSGSLTRLGCIIIAILLAHHTMYPSSKGLRLSIRRSSH